MDGSCLVILSPAMGKQSMKDGRKDGWMDGSCLVILSPAMGKQSMEGRMDGWILPSNPIPSNGETKTCTYFKM